jgi:uncharacterized protein YgiM (DUF1202 family)
MASVKDVARALSDAETPLLATYRELRAAAVTRAEQALAAAVSEAQRQQTSYLQFLCEDLPAQFVTVGAIGSDAVKLRQGPGGSHPQVGELKAGTPVIVVEWSGYWAEVQVPGGRRGYVFRDYVRTEGAPPAAAAWQR